jgi:hypothetical protein
MKPEHETGGGLEQETPAVQLGGSLIPTYGTHRVKNPGLEDGVWITDGKNGFEIPESRYRENGYKPRVEYFRGDLQPGKVAMPRGPRGEKAPRGAPQKSKLRRSKTVHHDGRVAGPGRISRAKVRVKDLHSHSVRALLASRALLVKTKQNLENQIRGLLKNLALVIVIGRAKFNVFAVRAEELIEDRPELIAMVGPPYPASCGIVQDCMIFNSVVLRFLLRIVP